MHEEFKKHTQMFRNGNAFDAINAKLERQAQDRRTTSYGIVRVDRDRGENVCVTVNDKYFCGVYSSRRNEQNPRRQCTRSIAKLVATSYEI